MSEQSSISPLYIPVPADRWPIVYHPEYNIKFGGLERLHPFDSGKWGRVVQFLVDDGLLKQVEDCVQPLAASKQDLLQVHTRQYLRSLKCSFNVAKVTEVPIVAFVPNPLVQRKLLKPFRLHTGGSILAAKLALERGWAINMGGGFHHCCSSRGGGFCAFADITLAVRFLQRGLAGQHSRISRAMIVDLDAHQGNGHARDFIDDDDVFILDAYNADIYPGDIEALRGIKCAIPLHIGTGDGEFLPAVERALLDSLSQFTPDLLVYNAGTDIMQGDPLGAMRISEQGIIKRDEMVFSACRTRNIPIMMVTSGGYQRSNARVIANSILNLYSKQLIQKPKSE